MTVCLCVAQGVVSNGGGLNDLQTQFVCVRFKFDVIDERLT